MNRHICVMLVIIFTFCAFARTASAVEGFDLSYFQGDVSESSLSCLRNSGREFGIIQATAGSSGRVNPYVANVLKRAHNAGIKYLDIYVFLHFPNDAAQQIRDVVNFLNNNGAGNLYGQIWIDVEGPKFWGSCAQNIQYFKEAVAEIQKHGKTAAIYSSESQWSPIMCGSTEFSHLQLWYAHYDYNPSFSDFKPFGGWSKPAIKQYAGTTSVCGTSIDKDFY